MAKAEFKPRTVKHVRKNGTVFYHRREKYGTIMWESKHNRKLRKIQKLKDKAVTMSQRGGNNI